MQEGQSRGQIMRKSVFNQCQICRGTGVEVFQAKELANIAPDRYKNLIEDHISLYGSVEFSSQGYAIPCRGCNGGHMQMVQATQKRANIPASFYDKYIEDFDRDIYLASDGSSIDMSKKMQAVDSFINDFEEWDKEGLGLYICSGMKGSGKTFLASCICNSLIKNYPINTKFVSAAELLNLSKQSDGSGNYESDPIALLCNCKLLVIDDLGQKNCGSDWMNDVLFQITDARYQKRLVTIYTSNVKISDLELDDRVVDRINRTTIQMSLPEYCVRSKEANARKMEFLKKIGVA